jgi:hypothetical protein
VRGEIDITMFESMLDELAESDHSSAPDRETVDERQATRTLPQFRPRADIPTDWS